MNSAEKAMTDQRTAMAVTPPGKRPERAAERLRALAWMATGVVYVAIVLGVLVRITGSGTACGTSWPRCAGEWLPAANSAAVLDYVHRVSTLLVTVLVGWTALHAWRRRAVAGVPAALAPALAALALLGVQITLGAISVRYRLADPARSLHLLVSMLLTGALLVTALRAGTEPRPFGQADRTTWLLRGCAALALLVGWLGALVANLGLPVGSPQPSAAALACGGFPLCNGALLPAWHPSFIAHWTHRMVAYGFVVVALAAAVVGNRRGRGADSALALVGAGLVLGQVAIAATMIVAGLPDLLRALHMALGTAIWAVYLAAAVLAAQRHVPPIAVTAAARRTPARPAAQPIPHAARATAAALAEAAAAALAVTAPRILAFDGIRADTAGAAGAAFLASPELASGAPGAALPAARNAAHGPQGGIAGANGGVGGDVGGGLGETTGTQRAGLRAAHAFAAADATTGADESTGAQVLARVRQRVADCITLTKPRIISLLLVTALVPMVLAAGGWPGTALVLWTMLGCYLIAGSANALNMYFDRDIDARMARTSLRPIPSGRMSPRAVLVYAVALGMAALHVFGAYINPLAGLLALLGLLYYVVIYTRWLKRSTPQNIVIGGAAGAFLPLIGWAAVTGEMSAAAVLLFAIVVLWTPPHFWALAIVKRHDYARAGVPMAPNIWGVRRTTRQMVVYGALLVPTTLALALAVPLGPTYLFAAAGLGIWMMRDLLRLHAAAVPAATAWPVYRMSLLYLALLFAAMALDIAVRTPLARVATLFQ
jgi:heme o synthase